jgi:hypothetical protein
VILSNCGTIVIDGAYNELVSDPGLGTMNCISDPITTRVRIEPKVIAKTIDLRIITGLWTTIIFFHLVRPIPATTLMDAIPCIWIGCQKDGVSRGADRLTRI